MRTDEEILAEVNFKGATQFHILEVLLDIRELSNGGKIEKEVEDKESKK